MSTRPTSSPQLRRRRGFRRGLACRLLLCLSVLSRASIGEEPSPAAVTPPDAALLAQFEREVRPILVEHCIDCHGPKKQEMGLRLDSSAGLLQGSDSGPVVVTGDPEQSSLIEAVRYHGGTKMPPEGKLPAAAIASLERWVAAGAVWPAEAAMASPKTDPREAARRHWAFQPLTHPDVPSVVSVDRVRHPIDAFVLLKLESNGLTLAPPADRSIWLRRVTFDLHGLPPTRIEIEAFLADESPEAFLNVVDRLLASPRYGERWGRYWLDVARYADTKGYVRLNENPRFPSSWTYRDYVIEAFNADMPFDQFVREQLAADLLPEDPSQPDRRLASLAALGFLTLGQRFLNSPADIIDDRIDVVSRGLLGLSVACARCHDHKFDPVPTRDYYGLYGVFANSVEPREPPLILAPANYPRYASYLTELKTRTAKLEEYLRAQHAALTQQMKARAGEYLLAGQYDPIQPNFLAVMFLVDASKDLNPVMVQRWARRLHQSRKQHDPVLAPWNELADWVAQRQRGVDGSQDVQTAPPIPPAEFGQQLQQFVSRWRSAAGESAAVNPVVVDALAQSRATSLAEVARAYGTLLQTAEQMWETSQVERPASTALADADWEEVRQLMMGEASPFTFTIEDVEDFLFVDATTQQQLHAQQRLVTDWIASPEAAPHAMALQDVDTPKETRVFIRGNASNLGELAPRQFLSVLRSDGDQPFQLGSGRLELANAIASADNPLTARVLVNRVWMHHFGAGLVKTPSDFGVRGEPPSHPELLDFLAEGFIRSGWSIKELHRQMVLSEVYRSRSQPADEATERHARSVDAENTLLWRMNRRRLDWEALRDSLLFVSGQLDETRGGPSVDLFSAPYSTRRSVYGLIDRLNVASELKAFDFAPPDASSPQRHHTTVPQQALFLMNSPFLKQTVQALSKRLAADPIQAPEQRLQSVYWLLFGRPAREDEVILGVSYLAESGEPASLAAPVEGSPEYLSAWEELLQALLLSNEFLFVD